jgi:hypothetical protein
VRHLAAVFAKRPNVDHVSSWQIAGPFHDAAFFQQAVLADMVNQEIGESLDQFAIGQPDALRLVIFGADK